MTVANSVYIFSSLPHDKSFPIMFYHVLKEIYEYQIVLFAKYIKRITKTKEVQQ